MSLESGFGYHLFVAHRAFQIHVFDGRLKHGLVFRSLVFSSLFGTTPNVLDWRTGTTGFASKRRGISCLCHCNYTGFQGPSFVYGIVSGFISSGLKDTEPGIWFFIDEIEKHFRINVV